MIVIGTNDCCELECELYLYSCYNISYTVAMGLVPYYISVCAGQRRLKVHFLINVSVFLLVIYFERLFPGPLSIL